MKGRFVWRDGNVDHVEVEVPLRPLVKRVAVEPLHPTVFEATETQPYVVETRTFQLERFEDGSFQYREVGT